MRRNALPPIVYAQLYPHPRQSDPPCFASHLTKNLIGEVRTETQTFYGTLDCIEARYPGLDYTYGPHRMRLSRFPHHRRLFRAFDELRLTKDEILSMCRWEGTKWARERYEREEGIKVRDTTGDEIDKWEPWRANEVSTADGIEIQYDEASEQDGRRADQAEDDDEVEEEGADDDESEEEIESVGIELNQRLSAAAALRESGADAVMDEEWEQWLKERLEAAEQNRLPDPIGTPRGAGHTFPTIASLAGQMAQGVTSSNAASTTTRTGTAL